MTRPKAVRSSVDRSNRTDGEIITGEQSNSASTKKSSNSSEMTRSSPQSFMKGLMLNEVTEADWGRHEVEAGCMGIKKMISEGIKEYCKCSKTTEFTRNQAMMLCSTLPLFAKLVSSLLSPAAGEEKSATIIVNLDYIVFVRALSQNVYSIFSGPAMRTWPSGELIKSCIGVLALSMFVAFAIQWFRCNLYTFQKQAVVALATVYNMHVGKAHVWDVFEIHLPHMDWSISVGVHDLFVVAILFWCLPFWLDGDMPREPPKKDTTKKIKKSTTGGGRCHSSSNSNNNTCNKNNNTSNNNNKPLKQ
eukprot:GHVQ01033783.1.p1 GENE.GHVQ01033783.1~~GHVQ01033783.1.p1  ORF type:complete len:304 (+),score=48.73 GHVQ01033783.1:896-1807(+)